MLKVIFYILIVLGIILIFSAFRYAKKNKIYEKVGEIKNFKPKEKEENLSELVNSIIQNKNLTDKSLKEMEKFKKSTKKKHHQKDKTSKTRAKEISKIEDGLEGDFLGETELLQEQTTEILKDETELLDIDLTEVLLEKTEILTMEDEGELK